MILSDDHHSTSLSKMQEDEGLKPGPTAAITKTITITTQRKRILLVESLHAEYAHAHSTNVMRSLYVFIVIALVIAAV